MKKLITLLIAMGTIPTFAQTSVSVPDSATLTFITIASQGNLKEANTGQLAIKHAKSTDVKAFAEKMITDHTKANNELMKIVSSKGWQIPAPAGRDVAPDTMLTTSYGVGFDKMYVTMMLQDHQKTVDYFKLSATNVPDADVKAFIIRTLPVLRQHLANIELIATGMGIKYSANLK